MTEKQHFQKMHHTLVTHHTICQVFSTVSVIISDPPYKFSRSASACIVVIKVITLIS